MSAFFEKAQDRIAEIVQQLLTAERERRRQTWPDYTQFQWQTDKGWDQFLKANPELRLKYESAAWQLLFCETATALLGRITALEAKAHAHVL